jgi:hypothetical protein
MLKMKLTRIELNLGETAKRYRKGIAYKLKYRQA